MNRKMMLGALFHLIMTIVMVWMIYDLRQRGVDVNSAGSLAAQVLVGIFAYFSLLTALGLAALSFDNKPLKTARA